MLICENGDTFCTVSGGCLEADVMERAKKVLKINRAEVFTYDTTAEEESVFNLNMGCRGVMRILLEPIDETSPINKIFAAVLSDRTKRTFATYLGGDLDEKLNVGCRIFVRPNESIAANDAGVVREFPGIDDDLFTFHESAAGYETMRYVNETGEAEFAFESLLPPVLLA